MVFSAYDSASFWMVESHAWYLQFRLRVCDLVYVWDFLTGAWSSLARSLVPMSSCLASRPGSVRSGPVRLGAFVDGVPAWRPALG